MPLGLEAPVQEVCVCVCVYFTSTISNTTSGKGRGVNYSSLFCVPVSAAPNGDGVFQASDSGPAVNGRLRPPWVADGDGAAGASQTKAPFCPRGQ